MARIKFCHVIDDSNFNPLLYNSIKYSFREKFDYTVISFGKEGRLQEQMKELGINSFSLNQFAAKKKLTSFYQLYKFFRREKIQIVQAHLFNSSLIGLAAAKFAGVPVRIFTGHHSHEVPLHKRRFLTFVDGIGGRFLANHTIAPSGNMKEIFIKYQKIPAHKIEVIPHGFDLEHWRQEAKHGSDIKQKFKIENKIVFGAVGRLFWVKGFETLIKVFARIVQTKKDIVLLIAGDGADKIKLEELVNSLKVQDQIIFIGRREKIAAIMNEFDIFIHNALAESFGMVFIEAFALGKPIISTRVGIAQDIIKNGDNGFLIETENPDELEKAMLNMLKADWKKMGNNGREVAENFSIQKTQALCDNFYLKWLHQKQGN